MVGASGSGKSTLLHLLGPAGRARFRRGHSRRQADRQSLRPRARPAAEPHVRVHLPVLSPAARADGARERADAAVDPPRPLVVLARTAAGCKQEGTRAAGASRARASPHPSAVRALRRRDAAGGDRPGTGRPARGLAGRRADRQPRRRQRPGGARAAARLEPRARSHYDFGNARSAHCPAGRPGRSARRRPNRRDGLPRWPDFCG